MRSSRWFVVGLVSFGLLVAAVSSAAPTVGTAPPLGTAQAPLALAPRVVSFSKYVGPSGVSAQFYSTGPVSYAVEVKNFGTTPMQRKVMLKPTFGPEAFELASAVASAGPGQTATVKLTHEKGLEYGCSPTEYFIEIEGAGKQKATTTPTCTYSATITDPWASLPAADRAARENGHIFVTDAKLDALVCKVATKQNLQARNNTPAEATLRLRWINAYSEPKPLRPGTASTFVFDSPAVFMGQPGTWKVDLAPGVNLPAGAYSPREYEAKIARQCTLATALVN